MDPSESSRPPRAVSPVAEAVIAMVIAQVLLWLFTAGLLDGGFVCGVYSAALLTCWTLAALVWLLRLARSRSLGRVIAVSGLLPPTACLLWLLWLFGLLRG